MNLGAYLGRNITVTFATLSPSWNPALIRVMFRVSRPSGSACRRDVGSSLWRVVWR